MQEYKTIYWRNYLGGIKNAEIIHMTGKALSRLQNELNSELCGCLYQLRQIEAGYDKKKEGASYQNLDTAITSGRYFFSALGVELGRQGEELTESATIYYGSASETAANALASTTHQNDVVMKLSDRAYP